MEASPRPRRLPLLLGQGLPTAALPATRLASSPPPVPATLAAHPCSSPFCCPSPRCRPPGLPGPPQPPAGPRPGSAHLLLVVRANPDLSRTFLLCQSQPGSVSVACAQIPRTAPLTAPHAALGLPGAVPSLSLAPCQVTTSPGGFGDLTAPSLPPTSQDNHGHGVKVSEPEAPGTQGW